MERELVQATWGLVVATALLVAVAIIPLVRDAADRRERRRNVSAELVPDINILRSRLEGGCAILAQVRSLSEHDIRFQAEGIDQELAMAEEIIERSSRPSLLFANETYIIRHLLTQARFELRKAVRLIGKSGGDEVRARDDALLRARRLYKAALMSLDASEKTLPAKVRTIKRESEGYSGTLFVMPTLSGTAACLNEGWPVSRKDVVTTQRP